MTLNYDLWSWKNNGLLSLIQVIISTKSYVTVWSLSRLQGFNAKCCFNRDLFKQLGSSSHHGDQDYQVTWSYNYVSILPDFSTMWCYDLDFWTWKIIGFFLLSRWSSTTLYDPETYGSVSILPTSSRQSRCYQCKTCWKNSM
jgi:hypothetical protein